MRIYPAHRDNATLGRLTWRAVSSLDTRSWGIIATSACVGLRIETGPPKIGEEVRRADPVKCSDVEIWDQ